MTETSIKPLFGLLSEELKDQLALSQRYRADQLFSWLSQGTETFEEMTNLPKALRSRLSELFGRTPYTTKVEKRVSDADGTVKLLLELKDGNYVECVLLTDEEGRRTACISSQVGCAMRCAFCRTGELGLERNLDAAEIVEQYLHLAKIAGNPTHIVYMGMGEPLANLDAVEQSIKIFHHPKGLNISARRMTISTCGLPAGIRRIAEDFPIPVKLAVSLTSADDAQRNTLMPINRRYPLAQLKSALLTYQKERKKRITLEYVLLKGENDSEVSADALRTFAGGLDCFINVIPWNPGAGLPFKEPERKDADSFCRALEKRQLRVTRRFRRGRGINGACGQLAGKDSGV